MLRVWLIGVVVSVAAGCGSDPAPPPVDAAAEADDERLIKEADARERKVKKTEDGSDG